MSSLQTFFRTAIMLATLGIAAKAWYLYGPSVVEMKAISGRAVELGQQAWADYWQEQNNGSRLAGEPAPFVPPAGVAPIPVVPSVALGEGAKPQAAGPVQLTGGAPALLPQAAVNTGVAPQPTRLPRDPGATLTPSDPPAQDDGLQKTLERLASLGVADQELGPWGNEGRLCRFSCSAPFANSASFTRHFEAVAATPQAAVEQVAAEIDAWQKTQR